MRHKEFEIHHVFRGVRRVRVTEEQAQAARERDGEISMWGRDLDRDPSNDLMWVYLRKDDWDTLPWTEYGEGEGVRKTSSEATLPPGKACADCQHMERCKWLLQQRPDATKCDWIPSRFLERRANDTEPSP